MANFGERMQEIKREKGDAARASLHAEYAARLARLSKARHRDGDPHNNAVDNLEVVPATEE